MVLQLFLVNEITISFVDISRCDVCRREVNEGGHARNGTPQAKKWIDL